MAAPMINRGRAKAMNGAPSCGGNKYWGRQTMGGSGNEWGARQASVGMNGAGKRQWIGGRQRWRVRDGGEHVGCEQECKERAAAAAMNARQVAAVAMDTGRSAAAAMNAGQVVAVAMDTGRAAEAAINAGQAAVVE